jgi:pimeloyl-ACP methyl ester carboxylesterase
MTIPATPRDAEPRSAGEPGRQFTYTDEGSGPVIVAVHGLPGSTRDFRWLAAALPDSIRFVRLDLPGFGGTPLSSGARPGIDARGAFVAGALAALGIRRCLLVGHSMGGAVALSAAVQASNRVAALGLLASIGLRPHLLLRRFVGVHAFARAVDLPLVRRPTLALLKTVFRRLGFSALTPEREVAHTLRCVSAVDFQVQADNTARLSVPVLAAWAKDDPFIERAVFEEHAAALPPGPRLTWPSGGHNIQKSQAVELASALVELASA